MIDFTLDQHVAVVTMDSGENRFNYTFLQAFLDVLDRIEQETSVSVLVVRSAHEKIWSNGIDLEWLLPTIEKEGRETARAFPLKIMELLRRILMYPMITIAAVNGHAFAGGAILASAFDFRFMRSDRGFFCLPEVDIHVPLIPGMAAVVRKAVPLPKFLEMQYTGKRLTAQECQAHQIVLKACHGNDLMNEVMAFAKSQNKDRQILLTMKKVTYKDILRIMDEEDPVYLDTEKTGF